MDMISGDLDRWVWAGVYAIGWTEYGRWDLGMRWDRCVCYRLDQGWEVGARNEVGQVCML